MKKSELKNIIKEVLKDDINSPFMMKLRAEKDKLKNQPLKSKLSHSKQSEIVDIIFNLEKQLEQLLYNRDELQHNVENVADVESGELNDEGQLLVIDKQIKPIVNKLNLLYDKINDEKSKKNLKNEILKVTSIIGSEIL